jgi:hypothetical protein
MGVILLVVGGSLWVQVLRVLVFGCARLMSRCPAGFEPGDGGSPSCSLNAEEGQPALTSPSRNWLASCEKCLARPYSPPNMVACRLVDGCVSWAGTLPAERNKLHLYGSDFRSVQKVC